MTGDPTPEPGTSTAGPTLVPLPSESGLHGTSTASSKGFKVQVTNRSGYLCHITLECTFNVPPAVVFTIFTNPDNAGVFRDIKGVGQREVLQETPNWKRVQVEQLGELRIMWIRRTFSTFLNVEESAVNPEHLYTIFELMSSDVLEKFNGRWDLYPVRDADSGSVVGTRGVLTQDILPKGMPAFMAHVPVLGGVLRGVSVNAIKRLVQDIQYIITKISPSVTVQDALLLVAQERGFKPLTTSHAPLPVAQSSKVTSFAVHEFSDDDDGPGSPSGGPPEGRSSPALQSPPGAGTAPLGSPVSGGPHTTAGPPQNGTSSVTGASEPEPAKDSGALQPRLQPEDATALLELKWMGGGEGRG